MQPSLDAIRKGKTFLICSHVGPDGDAMASTLAMGLGLEQLGKRVVYYNQDAVPEGLRFLPGAGKVISELKETDSFDAAISMDCGAFSRLGDKFSKFKGYKQLINVDHHASNDRYGHINYIIPDAASTGEVVWSLLKCLGCKLTSDIATNIYCTLVTDTGCFRYSNTTAHTLRLASDMVEAGANPDFISQNLFERKPLVMFDLLRRLLERISVSSNGKCGWSVLYQTDLEETDADYDITEEFINYPRAINGVEIAVLFKELPGDRFKISLRSKTDADVSKICQSFGGGGHKRAAACIIKGTFEEVKTRLFSKIEETLSGARP